MTSTTSRRDFRDITPPRADELHDAGIRREMAIACHALFLAGLNEGVAGHLTAKSAEHADAFWVTPFGLDFGEVTPESLVLVDGGGRVLAGDGVINTAAFLIHSAIHRARVDAVSVAHTHGLYGRTYAAFGKPLRPLNQNACAFYDDLGVHAEYTGPVLDERGVQGLASSLAAHKAMILKHHGLITVGGSVGEAAWWMVALERACQVELLARAAGPCDEVAPGVAAATAANVGTARAALVQYQPLRRRAIASLAGQGA